MGKMKFAKLVVGALLLGGVVVLFAVDHPTAAAEEDHAKLFKVRCASCHGVDGKGQTTAGKDLGMKDWTDGKTLKSLSDDKIREMLRNGVKAPDGKERMPPLPKLTDEQVTALVKHVRSFQ